MYGISVKRGHLDGIRRRCVMIQEAAQTGALIADTWQPRDSLLRSAALTVPGKLRTIDALSREILKELNQEN